MRYRFDRFEIDTARFELLRDRHPCAVEPRVFDLIAHFAARPQQVLSVDELIASVWQGRIVSDTTVSTCIKNARKALGDSGEVQRYIKTVRGRGYCFEAPVERIDAAEPPPAALQRPAPTAASTRNPMPALLLIPLHSAAGEQDAQALGAALVDDLAAILTRIPMLRIARHGPRDAAGNLPGPRALHESFGVDFLVDGSVRRLGEQFSIHVQLVDARTGFQLWAARFDLAGPLATAQADAPIAVVGKLEPQLQRAIYDAVRVDTGEPGARQLFLEAASALALKGWLRTSFAHAADLLRQSAACDPDFALTSAYLALVVGLGQRVGLVGDRQSACAEAQAAAEHALALDAMDSTVLGYAGCALADIGFPERARPILRNAIELNPANAQAWAALGSACIIGGQAEEGCRHLAHGMSISPFDARLSFWGTVLSMGLLQLGQVDDALREAQRACERDDRCYLPRVALAAVQLLRHDQVAARTAMLDAARIETELGAEQIHAIAGPQLAPTLIDLLR